MARKPISERFWSKVSGGDVAECWIWNGAKGHADYGLFGGRAAHRVAYELMRGEIPNGLYLDHLCSNPPCVNPWHLDPVSARMNSARSIDRGRGNNAPGPDPFNPPTSQRYAKPVFARAVEWAIQMKESGHVEEITLELMKTSGGQNQRQALAAMSWLAHFGHVDEKWKLYNAPRPPRGIVQIVPDRPFVGVRGSGVYVADGSTEGKEA